ncbi:hypothetical protein GCM10023115_43400 [Pontixanthobacter gangjinensis]
MSFPAFSQEIEWLEGRVQADSLNVSNIHVVNLNFQTGTTTNQEGDFKIRARLGDTLFFSSIQFENRKIQLKKQDLKETGYVVQLYPARNELEEVQLTDLRLSGHLDADLPKIDYFKREKYGIPYPERKLTQTELKLYTASAGIKSRWAYLGVLLGGVPLDVIINDINGRTKYLQNVLDLEKMQARVQKGIDLLGGDFFIEELELPQAEIENFVFYCATDPRFTKNVQSSNPLDLIDLYESKIEAFINLRELNAKTEN